MKKFFILLMAMSLIGLWGCSKNEKDVPVESENEVKKIDEIDDTKDRYGREYVEDKIIIKSEELKELAVDFFTRFTLGDPSSIDLLYMDKDKKEALKNLLTTGEGSEFIKKVLEKAVISADGIPDAPFLRSELDENGNGFNPMTQSNITMESVSYRYFLDTLRVKYEEPITDIEELFSYIDRYNEYYPAMEHAENAFSFVYVDGKPMIEGESFLGLFDFLKGELSKDEISPLYLVRDGYLKKATNQSLDNIVLLLSENKYIDLYEYLRRNELLDQLNYNPKVMVKSLYAQAEPIRRDFVDAMLNFDKPLLKVYEKDGNVGLLVIYYYPDSYGTFATGKTFEASFKMTKPSDLDGVMIERIVQNILAKQGTNIDIEVTE